MTTSVGQTNINMGESNGFNKFTHGGISSQATAQDEEGTLQSLTSSVLQNKKPIVTDTVTIKRPYIQNNTEQIQSTSS